MTLRPLEIQQNSRLFQLGNPLFLALKLFHLITTAFLFCTQLHFCFVFWCPFPILGYLIHCFNQDIKSKEIQSRKREETEK